MGSFYTESSYNFGTNSAQFPADRERCQGETAERYKGEAASGTREKPRAAQGRGRERYKGDAAERYKGEPASDTKEGPRAVQRRGRERYKGEAASDTRERTRAVQRRGRERYKGEDASGTKENKEDGTAGDRKDNSVSPTVPSPIRLRTI